MSIQRFNPITFPRKPINNITPFSYRDGYTFLEVIEQMRQYVEHELVGMINAQLTGIIDAFGEALEDLIEANQTQADNLEAVFNDRITELNDNIAVKVDAFDAKINSLDTLYNAFVANVEDTFTQHATRWETYKTEISALIQIINDKSGPIGEKRYLLTTGFTTIDADASWPNTHPVRFIFCQDATGNRQVKAGNRIIGEIPIGMSPHECTELLLVPDGDGNFSVDRVQQGLRKMLTYVVEEKEKKTVATGTYEAFPVGCSLPNGRLLAAWLSSSSGHFAPEGNHSYIAVSYNYGESWVNKTKIPSPEPSALGHSIMAFATHRDRIAMVHHTNGDDGRKAWLTISNTVGGLTAPNPNPIYWSGATSWVYPCGFIWIDDGTTSGLMIATSYGGDGILVAHSRDEGLTWTQVAKPISNTPSVWPYSEAVITHMGGTELYMSIRYESAAIREIRHIRSYNLGMTWTEPTTAIVGALGLPQVTRLYDRTLLMTLRNHRPTSFPGSWAYAVSTNGGYSWEFNEIAGNLFMMYGQFIQGNNGSVILIGSAQDRRNSLKADVFTMPVNVGARKKLERTDTDWQPIPVTAGFTRVDNNAHYRVIDDVCYFRGSIRRTAGNFTGTQEIIGNLPDGAGPSSYTRNLVPGSSLDALLLVTITGNREVMAQAHSSAKGTDIVYLNALNPYPVYKY